MRKSDRNTGLKTN